MRIMNNSLVIFLKIKRRGEGHLEDLIMATNSFAHSNEAKSRNYISILYTGLLRDPTTHLSLRLNRVPYKGFDFPLSL